MLTMMIKKLFSGFALAMALACGGCDSSDTKSASVPAPVSGPDAPPPGGQVPPPAPVPTDPLPTEDGKLNVAAAFPGPGEIRVALVSPISVQFDADLMQGLELNQAITVASAAGPLPGSVTRPEADLLVFRPTGLWAPSTVYTITVDPALMSSEGLALSDGTTWQFTTIADIYTTSQAVIDECMSDLDVEMLAAVNQARTIARSCGPNARPAVGKLIWNCRLQQAAITHSEDMATNDFFEHAGSDGSSVSDRVTRTGYVWSHVGENLAAGQRTVTIVMESLLSSPGHCENIMSGHYTEFGFGYRINPDSFYRHYWTQNFARPFRL